MLETSNRSAAEARSMYTIRGGVVLRHSQGAFPWGSRSFSDPWIEAVLSSGGLASCRYRVGEDGAREVVDPRAALQAALGARQAQVELTSSVRAHEGTRFVVTVNPKSLSAALIQLVEPGDSPAEYSRRATRFAHLATHVCLTMERCPSTITGSAGTGIAVPRVFPPVQRPLLGDPMLVVDSRVWKTQHPDRWRRLAETPFPEGGSRTLEGDLLTLRWMEADYTEPNRVRDAMALAALWMARALDPAPDPNFNRFGDEPCRLPPHPPHPPLLRYDRENGRGICEVHGDGPASVDTRALAAAEEWMREGGLPDGAPLTSLGLVTGSRDAAVALAERIASFTPSVLAWEEDGQWWRLGAEGDWLRPGTERYARIEAQLPAELRK